MRAWRLKPVFSGFQLQNKREMFFKGDPASGAAKDSAGAAAAAPAPAPAASSGGASVTAALDVREARDNRPQVSEKRNQRQV